MVELVDTRDLIQKFEWQGEKSPVISPKVGGNPFLNPAIRNLL